MYAGVLGKLLVDVVRRDPAHLVIVDHLLRHDEVFNACTAAFLERVPEVICLGCAVIELEALLGQRGPGLVIPLYDNPGVLGDMVMDPFRSNLTVSGSRRTSRKRRVSLNKGQATSSESEANTSPWSRFGRTQELI